MDYDFIILENLVIRKETMSFFYFVCDISFSAVTMPTVVHGKHVYEYVLYAFRNSRQKVSCITVGGVILNCVILMHVMDHRPYTP